MLRGLCREIRPGFGAAQAAFEAGSFPRFAKQFVIAGMVAQLFDNLVGRNEVNSSDFLSNKPERCKKSPGRDAGRKSGLIL